MTSASCAEHQIRPEPTFMFDDPYWDDVFGTLYDSTMRVCSAFGC